jgi:hypothetical protein
MGAKTCEESRAGWQDKRPTLSLRHQYALSTDGRIG